MVDLRYELESLFNGVDKIGRWVVVRHYDKTQYSKYWNEVTKEAVGGPAYVYNDTIVETYSSPNYSSIYTRTQAGIQQYEQAVIDLNTVQYYFRYNVVVDSDDEVYELDYYGKTEPSSIDYVNSGTGVSIIEKYKIKDVINYRCDDHGRIEYKFAIAQKSYFRKI